MSGLYVNSNTTAMTAQNALTRNMADLTTTLTRLSTGYRINSAKDDPAGLIASELLKSDIAGTNAAITNVQRANSMLSTADSGMSNIGNLLTDIKTLVVSSANTGAMSADQIAANQLQVDATLEAIDQIAMSTTYGGQKILDGSMDFSTDVCGGTTGGISDLTVYSANFGTTSNISVDVDVKEAARRGTLIYNGNGVSQKTTIDVTGSTGTKSLTFGAGATNAEMAAAINAVSDSTGVQARIEGAASKGTVTLNGVGANNGIVITSNETGAAAGNYSFKIVAGDQDGVRIASQPTSSSSGVVEIMLKQSVNKSYQGVGGILDVTVTGGATATTAANNASGVSIKKGTTNQAVYHENNSNVTSTSADGTKTLTITAGAVGAGAVNATDASKLNGWTVKVATAGDVLNGQTVADGAAIRDDESKIMYVSDAAGFQAGVISITGTAGYTIGTGLTGGALAAGDEFKLGGGGAAGELELTYKEGATVNDLLKLANNAGGNIAASLSNGVDGTALVKDLLAGNSRMFTAAGANAMTTSTTTSKKTANDVINMINSQLGDKFTASLLTGDTGNGLMTYMDAAVDSGDVNMDNAIRFTGMDSGPIVRMSTTDSNGNSMKNQALSVSLINPSEADIANGIHTKVLQINLATDADGNSITTAQDLVDLFNSLTPEQTGGISASLILPDGVDPNGRTWVTDNCGNVTEVTDCNATYGTGIVQPTGDPGVCEITQNDLVLLGTNQSLTEDYAVARIGTTADHVPGGTAGVAGVAGDGTVSVTTGSNHSGLAGVAIMFTADDNQAGFDEATGTLTVYLSPATQSAMTDALITDAVNGSIAQNWQGIRQFNGATGNASTVTVATGGITTLADLQAAFDGTDVKFASATEIFDATNNTRGINASDSALKITALEKGTSMAGVTVVLEQDNTLAATAAGGAVAEIAVTYDKDTGALTIKANGVDGIDAGALAEALNNNDVFKQHFSAQGTLVTDADAADPPAFGTDYGTVYFGDGTTSSATFSGGYKIVTAEKATGTNNNSETSAGIGMTGGSDSNERLVLEATDVGSNNFVKVTTREGSFRTFCPLGYEMCELAGTDAVVTVNGLAASAQGNKISLNTADLSLSFTSDGNVGSSTFNITGGGALFQIGPDVVSSQQKRIGISSMMTTAIGGGSGKLFQLKSGNDADLTVSDASRKLADKIINESISYVANARGRIGALQSSLLDPMQTVLEDQVVALTEANSSIVDADFAEESSNLTRLQLLIQSGMSTLGIANQLPQYAASLVR